MQVVGCQEDATKFQTSQRKCSSTDCGHCHGQKMWHCECRKGTLVLPTYDSTLCLRSTSCFCHHGGPVQSLRLGNSRRRYPWSTRDHRKPRSWALMVGWGPLQRYLIPGHCLMLCQHWNIVPLLLFYDALPRHPNNNHEWTLLHTAAHRWLSGSFHRIAHLARPVTYNFEVIANICLQISINI